MRISGIILAAVLAFGIMPEADAQLKMVPKDKLESVNSPKLSAD